MVDSIILRWGLGYGRGFAEPVVYLQLLKIFKYDPREACVYVWMCTVR